MFIEDGMYIFVDCLGVIGLVQVVDDDLNFGDLYVEVFVGMQFIEYLYGVVVEFVCSEYVGLQGGNNQI